MRKHLLSMKVSSVLSMSLEGKRLLRNLRKPSENPFIFRKRLSNPLPFYALNGPFLEGLVVWRGVQNSPLTLMGRFPSLMGRFPTLMRFPKCLNGLFSLSKIPWKTAHPLSTGRLPLRRGNGLWEQLSTDQCKLSGHYSHDWSECVNAIGAISEPFAVNEDSEWRT